jgi:hypothetical protein
MAKSRTKTGKKQATTFNSGRSGNPKRNAMLTPKQAKFVREYLIDLNATVSPAPPRILLLKIY